MKRVGRGEKGKEGEKNHQESSEVDDSKAKRKTPVAGTASQPAIPQLTIVIPLVTTRGAPNAWAKEPSTTKGSL